MHLDIVHLEKSVDIEPICDARTSRVIWIAFVVALAVHAGMFMAWPFWQTRQTRSVFPPASVEILLHRESAPEKSVTADVSPPIRDLAEQKSDPDETMIRETSVPVPERAAEPSAEPARRSILQSVDSYVSNLPLSSQYRTPPADANANVFHPALREALATPDKERRNDERFGLLNTSTLAEASERVALDGKCFRLQDLGGGGDRRAWYPVACNGRESTSDAMARGLREALDHR